VSRNIKRIARAASRARERDATMASARVRRSSRARVPREPSPPAKMRVKKSTKRASGASGKRRSGARASGARAPRRGAVTASVVSGAPRAFGDGCVRARDGDVGERFLTGAVSFARRKIGGPTRRSAKGGWTPEEVRFFEFEFDVGFDRWETCAWEGWVALEWVGN